MKKVISVDSLKENVQVYMRLEKENANGWEWFCTCALEDFLQNENVTLAYIQQMTKEELDVTLSLSLEIVRKFKSLDLACAFLNVYEKYYGQGLDEENFYENEILPLLKVISEGIKNEKN
jgi:hypothetical protein